MVTEFVVRPCMLKQGRTSFRTKSIVNYNIEQHLMCSPEHDRVEKHTLSINLIPASRQIDEALRRVLLRILWSIVPGTT